MKRRTGRGLIGFFSQHNERGASLVEYSLLVALIAVVCVGSVRKVGGSAGVKSATAAACMNLQDADDEAACTACSSNPNGMICRGYMQIKYPEVAAAFYGS